MGNLSSSEREALFSKADNIRNLYHADIKKRVNTPIIGSLAVNPITGMVYDLKKKKHIGNVRSMKL